VQRCGAGNGRSNQIKDIIIIKKLRLVHRRRTGPCRRNFLLLSQRRAGRDFVSSSPFQFAFEVQTPDVTVQVFRRARKWLFVVTGVSSVTSTHTCGCVQPRTEHQHCARCSNTHQPLLPAMQKQQPACLPTETLHLVPNGARDHDGSSPARASWPVNTQAAFCLPAS